MVSVGLTWFGATKPFFVNDRGLKEKIPEDTWKKNYSPLTKKFIRETTEYMRNMGVSSHTANMTRAFLQSRCEIHHEE